MELLPVGKLFARSGYKAYLSYRAMAGEVVDISEVRAALEQLPLVSVLPFLTRLSRDLLSVPGFATTSQLQWKYIKLAQYDDFPAELPVDKRYLYRGRLLPHEKDHVLVHYRNIATLSQLAVLFCHDSAASMSTDYWMKRRICRMLLIVNDYFAKPIAAVHNPTLIERRDGVTQLLGLYQYAHDPAFYQRAVHSIARQGILYSSLESPGALDIGSTFSETTGGITIEDTLGFIAILIGTVQAKLQGDKVLFPRTLLHNAPEEGKAVAALLASKWIRTPGEYRSQFEKLVGDPSKISLDQALNLQCLRTNPLIAVSSEAVACPCPLFLRDLALDSPYYLIVDALAGSDKQRFQSALGDAFAKYVEPRIDRIANRDTRGTWRVFHRVIYTKSGSEVEIADSLLCRGSSVLVIEYKGQRPGRDFLSGRSGDRVLGPSDEVLFDIEAGRNYDRQRARNTAGWLTQGIWQHSINESGIFEWVSTELGIRISKIRSVLINLSPPEMDEIVRTKYVEDLIAKAELYGDARWRNPQWLTIEDLEKLAAIADNGSLDLESLLESKDARPSSRFQRFGDFLSEHFESIPVDAELAEYADVLFKRAARLLPNSPR